MPQSRGKTHRDANQSELEEDMALIRATTVDLSSIGSGAGDILVGYGGRNWFFELKDSSQPLSKRKLRPNQVEFHRAWRGQIDRVEESWEAMAIMGVPATTIQQVKKARLAKRALQRRIKEASRGKEPA